MFMRRARLHGSGYFSETTMVVSLGTKDNKGGVNKKDVAPTQFFNGMAKDPQR